MNKVNETENTSDGFLGSLVMLVGCWWVLTHIGLMGREVEGCANEVDRLNAIIEVIDKAGPQLSAETQRGFITALNDANYCAAQLTTQEGDLHRVKEDWIGEDYSVLIYEKWDWVPW